MRLFLLFGTAFLLLLSVRLIRNCISSDLPLEVMMLGQFDQYLFSCFSVLCSFALAWISCKKGIKPTVFSVLPL